MRNGCWLWAAVVALCGFSVADAQDDLKAPSVAPLAARDERFLVTISKETTYLTEPLTKDGYVDYAAALNARFGRGVKPEDNAAVILWRITSDKVSDEHRARALKIWGIQPPDGPLVPIIPLFDQQRHTDAEIDELFRQQTDVIGRPWTEKEFPAIAAWIKANDDVLKIAVAASKKPKYFFPILDPDGLTDVPPVNQVTHVRLVWQLLYVRAMLFIGQKRYDEAWRDLLAIARLGRLLSQAVELGEWLLGNMLQNGAYYGMGQFLRYAPLDAAAVKVRRRELSELPPRQPVGNVIDNFDRFVILENARYLAQRTHVRNFKMLLRMSEWSRPISAVVKAIINNEHLRPDWNVALQHVNRCYDRLRELLKIKDYRQRKQAIETYLAQVAHLPRTPQEHVVLLNRLGDEQTRAGALGELYGAALLYVLAMPVPITDSEQRMLQQAELIDIGLSLAAWRAEYGGYPDSLEMPVPRYLRQVPRDHFSGEKLQYRKFEGGYLLISVGPNVSDDSDTDEDYLDGQWYHLDDVHLLVMPPDERKP